MHYLDRAKCLTAEINWNECLNNAIDNLRVVYGSNLSQKELDKTFEDSFSSPCQIEVLDSDNEAVWLVVHDKERKDKEFVIKKNN